MATYTGNVGDVTVAATAMGEVTQWSLTEGIGTANSAAKGDLWDTHSPGRKNFSATITAFFDVAAAAQTSVIIGASLAFVFRTGGSGTPNYAGTGTITGVAIESPEDPAGLVTLALTILGNGALTYSAT